MDIVAKWVALGLEITSGYGNKTVYGAKSDCSYYTDISKRAENKFVKSHPCSNRPVICEQCQDCQFLFKIKISICSANHALSKYIQIFENFI